jgi:hypothetical protein
MGETTRLESTEDVGLLEDGKVVDARMEDGYEGALVVCEQYQGATLNITTLARPDKSRVYLLVTNRPGFTVESGRLIQNHADYKTFRLEELSDTDRERVERVLRGLS